MESFSLVKKKVRNPSKSTRKIYERLYSDCSSFVGWKCNWNVFLSQKKSS